MCMHAHWHYTLQQSQEFISPPLQRLFASCLWQLVFEAGFVPGRNNTHHDRHTTQHHNMNTQTLQQCNCIHTQSLHNTTITTTLQLYTHTLTTHTNIMIDTLHTIHCNCIHTHNHKHIHPYIHAYIHAYMHEYVHTCTCTCT